MAEATINKLDVESAEKLEKQYDTALATRDNGFALKRVFYWFAIAFAGYHIYTAGFGTPAEHEHMGIHLAGLYVLIFAGFPLIRTQGSLEYGPNSWLRWGSIPLLDWVFMALGVCAALFLALS